MLIQHMDLFRLLFAPWAVTASDGYEFTTNKKESLTVKVNFCLSNYTLDKDISCGANLEENIYVINK